MAGALTLPLEKTIPAPGRCSARRCPRRDVASLPIFSGGCGSLSFPTVTASRGWEDEALDDDKPSGTSISACTRRQLLYLSVIAQHHPQCQHHLKMKLPTAPPLALAPVPEHARSGDTSEVPQLRTSRRCRHLQLAEPIRPNRGSRFRFKPLRSHHSGSRRSRNKSSYCVRTI